MIPNVSSIYRDLASLADPQSFRGGQTYSNTTSQNTVYAEKQERHNQLMEKLRNAQREMNSINSDISSSKNQSNVPYKSLSYQSYKPSFQVEERNRCQTPFFNQMDIQSVERSWKPPNIRYRHIQDFKPQSPVTPQVPLVQINRESKQKSALEKQFYDEPQIEEKKGSKKENETSTNPMIKEKVPEVDLQKDSDLSYGRTWMNRESKFEDKLQSYYELCKKRPGSSKIQVKDVQNGTISRGKFERSTGNKPIGLDLEKAIKMLSFD